MDFPKNVTAAICAAVLAVLLHGCMSPPPKVRVEPPTPQIEDRQAVSEQVIPQEPRASQADKEMIVPKLPGAPGESESAFPGEEPAAGVAVDFVRQRLEFHERNLAIWRELDTQLAIRQLGDLRAGRWPQCLASTEKILSAYLYLQQRLVQPSPLLQTGLRIAQDDVLNAAREDIEYLGSGCDAVLTATKTAMEGQTDMSKASGVELEALVNRFSTQGNHADAVATYRRLTAEYPGHRILPQTSRVYVLSLLATGDEDGARRTLGEIVSRSELDLNIWPLRRLYADFLLARGDVNASRQQYQKLAVFFETLKVNDFWVADQLALLETLNPGAAEFGDFSKFMRSFLSFDGRHVPAESAAIVGRLEAAYPESYLAVRARQIYRHMEEESSSWAGRQLIAADNLAETGNYEKAKVLLEGVLEQNTSQDVRNVVQRALDDVVVAESVKSAGPVTGSGVRETLPAEHTASWEEANRLLGMEQYDEATALFTGLFGTGYDQDARAKIVETSGKAAASLRNKAADLFLKARNVSSSTQKKDLMLQSWRLLKQIEEKYPQADIIDKVVKNRLAVEQQIRELDPLLLDVIQRGTTNADPLATGVPH